MSVLRCRYKLHFTEILLDYVLYPVSRDVVNRLYINRHKHKSYKLHLIMQIIIMNLRKVIFANFSLSSFYYKSTRYPEAISLLTSLLQASHTNALLTSTQKMLEHTLPLGSYLLKPVQRILRYHLLLDVSVWWVMCNSKSSIPSECCF